MGKAKTTLFRRQRPAPGSSPGTLVPPDVHVEPRLQYHRFGPDAKAESGAISLERALELRPAQEGSVLWIDVEGLGDASIVRQLGEVFCVHPLAQADIAHLGQRPKADEFPEQANLLIIARMATIDGGVVRQEQVSILKGPGLVLTFQENYLDCFDPLRSRIQAGRASLMTGGPDYLAVQILDAIVDGYFPVLELLGERLEALENAVLKLPRREHLQEIYRLRRELMQFRRAVWPLRDAVSRLLREEETVADHAVLYLRDVSDHLHQVIDVLETYREVGVGLIEIYLSTLAQRTNEVMRVLTVVTAIFIPLSFLAGVYGMNFDQSEPANMPELGWPFGYVFFWTVCLVAAGSMLYSFRRRGWLGSADGFGRSPPRT